MWLETLVNKPILLHVSVDNVLLLFSDDFGSILHLAATSPSCLCVLVSWNFVVCGCDPEDAECKRLAVSVASLLKLSICSNTVVVVKELSTSMKI